MIAWYIEQRRLSIKRNEPFNMTNHSKSRLRMIPCAGSFLFCLFLVIAVECDADMANEPVWCAYEDGEYGFSLRYNPEWTAVERSLFAEITIKSGTGDGIHLSQVPDGGLPDCNDIVAGETEEGSDTYPTDCSYVPVDRGVRAVLIDSMTSTGEQVSELFFPSPSGTWIMAPTNLTTREELIRVMKSVRFLRPPRR